MSRLPDVSEALWDIAEAVQFEIITKSVSDFEAKETVVNTIVFQGHLQPTPPQKLIIKPEGQRSWRWWAMWAKQDLGLDWILQDASGRQFRIMSRSDWGRAGYREYELTETVTPAI